MKSITVLIVSIVGLAYCVFATPSTNQLYSVCETTLDWLRIDENALNYMKHDEEVSSEFIHILESDESSENICDLLAIRTTGNEFIIGGLVRAVGAIIKAAGAAGRAARIGGRVGKTIKAAHKGAKFGRKVGRAIRDHDDKRKRRHHHRRH